MKYKLEQIEKNKDIVNIVNKTFHDLEFDNYENVHPEIYEREVKRWQEIFKLYIKNIHPATILDVGTGAGFIPGILIKYLTCDDKLIFSDISERMLELVEEKFNNTICKKEYLLSDSSEFKLGDNSIDIVTVNSVLHHIPERDIFFAEIDRILKHGGLFIIRHEPNRLFANSYILSTIYRFLKVFQKIRYIKDRQKDDLSFSYREIIRVLKEKGIEIEGEVSKEVLQSLIDIESPTARGDLDKEKGFNPFILKEIFFPEYSILNMETYSFLAKFDENKNFCRRSISKILKYLFPKKGYLFELILQKKNDEQE